MKALTYGNLGTGGLSTAAFEQTLPDDHPIGRHIPGFGTHTVEHRAIDPAGNYGKTESYKATVLPGGSPACGTTVDRDAGDRHRHQRRDLPDGRDGQRRRDGVGRRHARGRRTPRSAAR